MGSYLASHIHAVAIGDDLVFLDIIRDSYMCLPDAAAVAALSADRRSLTLSDPAAARELEAAGLLGAGPSGSPWAAPASPVHSAMSAACDPPRWSDLPEAAGALTDAWRAYRGRPLPALLAAVQAGRPGGAVADPEVAVIAGRFHRWVPYAPAPAKCLLRSFMLLRLLHRLGHDADWVFGVRTWPFRAHCWLQSGDLVLDDDVDRLVALHPILVV